MNWGLIGNWLLLPGLLLAAWLALDWGDYGYALSIGFLSGALWVCVDGVGHAIDNTINRYIDRARRPSQRRRTAARQKNQEV